jgi:expansin (peptidoglycan-binding protein)
MRGKTTFYVTLKVEVENGLIFKIERYLDGEWVHSERAEVEYFVHRALLGVV